MSADASRKDIWTWHSGKRVPGPSPDAAVPQPAGARRRAADVIVVGAGPAGSTTALLLARAGLRVLLLDRHEFPRAKPCGDCLSLGASSVLQRLGIYDRVLGLSGARLRGWQITAPDGGSFSAEFCPATGGAPPPADGALAIERLVLDAALLDAAIAAGATFRPGVRVEDLIRDGSGITGVRAGGETLRARLVVGADGLRSVVATRLNAVDRRPRLRKLSLTLHIDEQLVAAPVGEMHVGDGICVGIAPVRTDLGRSNITVVADSDRFGRAAATGARAFVRNAIAALPRLDGRIPAAAVDGARLLGSGPFDRPVHTTVFDGAALVGDAAGYYDPFTGQGLFQALATAELLAGVIVAAADAELSASVLRPYAVARARLLRGTRVVQHGIETMLARPAAANIAIRRIARAGPFASALLNVTGDVAPAGSLLRPRTLYSLIRTPRRMESMA